METKNLNVEIKEEIYQKVKAKSALLNLNISDFVERILDIYTKDIKYDKELK